ncbi:MAG: helix-hairpin-helix domain-containing protein [Burkholderiales bacterium]|nr:helix-hairpin-helix domain-containing protein [Burkholderiales bacterium]MDE2394611.1 helix-hairpin-helix domain-containing protein [Burkholderiales bacterium]MDE2452053.1 helix-hairpin-helix domain-containing protein [Burkholderiales bacterium]
MLKKLLVLLFALFTAAAMAAAVDVNKATQAELESVKGVGPAISTRILEARKSGEFKDWSDLIGRVKGLGGKNAVKLSGAGLTVGGAAYTAAPVAARPARTAASKPARGASKP